MSRSPQLRHIVLILLSVRAGIKLAAIVAAGLKSIIFQFVMMISAAGSQPQTVGLGMPMMASLVILPALYLYVAFRISADGKLGIFRKLVLLICILDSARAFSYAVGAFLLSPAVFLILFLVLGVAFFISIWREIQFASEGWDARSLAIMAVSLLVGYFGSIAISASVAASKDKEKWLAQCPKANPCRVLYVHFYLPEHGLQFDDAAPDLAVKSLHLNGVPGPLKNIGRIAGLKEIDFSPGIQHLPFPEWKGDDLGSVESVDISLPENSSPRAIPPGKLVRTLTFNSLFWNQRLDLRALPSLENLVIYNGQPPAGDASGFWLNHAAEGLTKLKQVKVALLGSKGTVVLDGFEGLSELEIIEIRGAVAGRLKKPHKIRALMLSQTKCRTSEELAKIREQAGTGVTVQEAGCLTRDSRPH